jgi:hypothetical protein
MARAFAAWLGANAQGAELSRDAPVKGVSRRAANGASTSYKRMINFIYA